MNFKKLLSLALVFTMVLSCASFFNSLTVSADTSTPAVISYWDGTFPYNTDDEAGLKYVHNKASYAITKYGGNYLLGSNSKTANAIYPISFEANQSFALAAAGYGSESEANPSGYVKSVANGDKSYYDVTYSLLRNASAADISSYFSKASPLVLTYNFDFMIPTESDDADATVNASATRTFVINYKPGGTSAGRTIITLENGEISVSVNSASKLTAVWSEEAVYQNDTWHNFETRYAYDADGYLLVGHYLDGKQFACYKTSDTTTQATFSFGHLDLQTGAGNATTSYLTCYDDITIETKAKEDLSVPSAFPDVITWLDYDASAGTSDGAISSTGEKNDSYIESSGTQIKGVYAAEDEYLKTTIAKDAGNDGKYLRRIANVSEEFAGHSSLDGNNVTLELSYDYMVDANDAADYRSLEFGIAATDESDYSNVPVKLRFKIDDNVVTAIGSTGYDSNTSEKINAVFTKGVTHNFKYLVHYVYDAASTTYDVDVQMLYDNAIIFENSYTIENSKIGMKFFEEYTYMLAEGSATGYIGDMTLTTHANGSYGEKPTNWYVNPNRFEITYKDGVFTAGAYGTYKDQLTAGCLVVAIYDSNGKLVSPVSTSSKVVEGTDGKEITVTREVPSGSTYKAFLFDTLTSAVPKIAHIEG